MNKKKKFKKLGTKNKFLINFRNQNSILSKRKNYRGKKKFTHTHIYIYLFIYIAVLNNRTLI